MGCYKDYVTFYVILDASITEKGFPTIHDVTMNLS